MITARQISLLLGLLISSACFGQSPTQPETRLVPIKQITQTGFGIISKRWRYTPPSRHHHAVVRVQTSGGAGTGAVVETTGKGVICLTNHHVVARAWTGNGFTAETYPTASLIGSADNPVRANVIYSNQELDIAILHAPTATAQVALPISEVMPPIGEDVELAGYGGPLPKLRTFLGRRVRTSQAVSIDAGVVSGDSGGPMIWNGALVGVNYGAPAAAGNMGQEQGWAVTGPASSNVDGPTLARVLTQQCTPYGCVPRIIRRAVPQRNVISEPPPASQPIAANPNCQCESQQGCDCDVDAIKAEILASLDLSQLKGANGATGAQGPMGPKGSPGAAGKDAQVNIDEIADAVISRLPPIYMRRVNDETKEVIAVEAIYLGEGFTFFETPGVTANAR